MFHVEHDRTCEKFRMRMAEIFKVRAMRETAAAAHSVPRGTIGKPAGAPRPNPRLRSTWNFTDYAYT
jgi:hypothetical protein